MPRHGGPWRTTNGFPQGCCLSCALVNALVATWLAILKQASLPEGVKMHLAAYADDQKVTLLAAKQHLSRLDTALAQVADLSVQRAEDADQGYNGAKSQLWVSHHKLAIHYAGKLVMQGQAVPTATAIIHLGADVPAPHPARSGKVKQATRIQEVLAPSLATAAASGLPGAKGARPCLQGPCQSCARGGLPPP